MGIDNSFSSTMAKIKLPKKSGIFLRLLLMLSVFTVTPLIISSLLIIFTYQEIINKYLIGYTQGIIAKEELFSAISSGKTQILLMFSIILILTLFVSILAGRKFSRPIKRLVQATYDIKQGIYNPNIEVESRDEIGELAISFNQMTRALKETHLQLAMEKNIRDSVITNLVDGLILLDRHNRILILNPAAEKILKVNFKNLQGESFQKIPFFAEQKIFLQSIKDEKTLDKKEFIFNEPMKLVIEASVVPVVDNEKKKLGSMIIFHDFTREKAIDVMKSEFINVVAHQLRTPLSAIKWIIKMILDRDAGKINKEQEELLNKGYQSNERMIWLINDLLNVSRIEEGRFLYEFSIRPLDLIVKEAVDSFYQLAEERGVKLIFDEPKSPLPPIKVDAEKLMLAIKNLIENAIRYSLKKSKVTTSLKYDKITEEIEVKIKDEGLGIPEHQRKRAFTKFFRGDNIIKLQTEGTGLGLFITKNIIEAHNGKIWFESEEGKGTTFYFRLPINK